MRHIKIVLKEVSPLTGKFTELIRDCTDYQYGDDFVVLSFTGGFGAKDKVLMVPFKNILCLEEF